MQKRLVLFTLSVLIFTAACSAQGNRPSPAASASCDLGGGKTIKTDYSSPRVKGRKIFGDLVPFGKVWRNGANEATTFVTSTDLVVGGTTVPAGAYTLFVLPNADKWTLIISRGTGEWGTDYPGPEKDLARVNMKLSKLPSPVENFTIAYDKVASGCILREDWDTISATVDIAAK
jgi:hypothetical protein